jgi:hypothetical protein
MILKLKPLKYIKYKYQVRHQMHANANDPQKPMNILHLHARHLETDIFMSQNALDSCMVNAPYNFILF